MRVGAAPIHPKASGINRITPEARVESVHRLIDHIAIVFFEKDICC